MDHRPIGDVKHACELPPCDDPLDTVWRCRECQQYWILKEVRFGFNWKAKWVSSYWRNVVSGYYPTQRI